MSRMYITTGMSNMKAGEEISFEGTVNFRELGGYQAGDGRTVRFGQFYRCGALGEIVSDKDKEKLAGLGIQSIIDFRSKGEWDSCPDPELAGVKHQRICALRYPTDHTEIDFSPEGMAGSLQKMEDMARQYGGAARVFAGMYADMPFSNPAFQALFTELREGRTPLLFHCMAGKDRTGIAAILILLLLGVDRETALDDYELTNVYRKPYVDRLLAEHAEEISENPDLERDIIYREGVSRELAAGAIDAIETRYGSYERFFLEEFGIDRAELKRLRDLYLE